MSTSGELHDATGWETLRRYVRSHSAKLDDLAYLALGLFATLGTLVAAANSGHTFDALVGGVVNLTLTAALLWRRRFPVLIAVAGVASAAFASGELVMALTLFSLAIRRRDRSLVVLSIAGIVAMTVAGTARGTHPVGAAISSVLLVGMAVGMGSFVGARRQLVDSLRERAERAESEQHLRADQARLAERARIAQEMHDVLAHKISLVALHAGGLEVRPDAGPEQVERAAGLIRITAREALEDLRGVLGVLRSDTTGDGVALTPQPTLADVNRLVDASVRAGVPVTLETDVQTGVPVPDPLGRTAYRVVQEALTNVHKHAHGTATTVRIEGRAGEGFRVEVANLQPVGRTLDPLLPGAGMGLLGLGERVRLTGGQFTAGPEGDQFVVRASLPWPAAEVRTSELRVR
ncbi:MAG TPA: histidine kinase [Actinomycetales bacterium]|nr:histidine kinase [Actinomycetales bacterium]